MNKRIKKKKLKITNKKLVERYPFLIPRNVWTDQIPNDYDYTYTLADQISQGWRKAFGMELFEELREDLISCYYLDQFRFLQIKEKYGSLRLYCGSVPMESKAFNIIDKYERMSETICECCGKPNQKIHTVNGWEQCICPNCEAEQRKKRDRELEKIVKKYNYKTD